MKKLTLASLIFAGMVPIVHAQTTAEVRTSTDPARIAAIERHAQALKAAHAPAGPAAPVMHHTHKPMMAKPHAKGGTPK